MVASGVIIIVDMKRRKMMFLPAKVSRGESIGGEGDEKRPEGNCYQDNADAVPVPQGVQGIGEHALEVPQEDHARNDPKGLHEYEPRGA